MKLLLGIFALWLLICLVPDGRSAAGSTGDPSADTVQIYAPYTCDTGRWYFETSDADSVTVNCYHPDPPSDEDGGN